MQLNLDLWTWMLLQGVVVLVVRFYQVKQFVYSYETVTLDFSN